MSSVPAGFADPTRKNPIARFHWAVLAAVAVAAILFQVYVPLFLTYLGFLELPLLVTVYYALMRRSPVYGLLFGALIGLAQDALSPHAIGMFGIAKTLVGYFAAGISQRFDVETPMIRLLLAFFFFVFHQFFYWVLTQTLLGQPLSLDPPQMLLLGVLNAAAAVPLYHILDKLRVSD